MNESKVALLYTHKIPPANIWPVVVRHLEAALVGRDVEMVVISNEPRELPAGWRNILKADPRGAYFDCYGKIVAGLEATERDVVFLLEHDVMYPPEYFELRLPEQAPEWRSRWWYQNWVYTENSAGFWETPRTLTSQLVADRTLLLETFRRRLEWLAGGGTIDWDEPGKCRVGQCDTHCDMGMWRVAGAPTIDLRYGGNLTGMRQPRQDGRYRQRIPGWPPHDQLWAELGLSKDIPTEGYRV